jgi:hypothetical protein
MCAHYLNYNFFSVGVKTLEFMFVDLVSSYLDLGLG